MAGQDDISLKMTLDASDVESGVESVGQKVDQLGPAAAASGSEAAAGLNEIGSAAQSAEQKVEGLDQAAKDTWTALSGLGDEGKAAASALSKLEAAGDSPRTLLRNAALAEVELKQLRAAIDQAAASGKKFGPEVAEALAKAEAKIGAAAARSRELADATGDLKTKGDQAAKGFEAVAGSAGSFEGILGQLKDTSGPVGQSMADLGFKGVALASAFMMGYEAGGKINSFLEQHGNYLAKAIDATTLFITGGTSEADMLRALDGPVNKSLRAHQELAKSAADAAAAAKGLGVAFTTEGTSISAWTNKVAALSLAMVTAKNNGTEWDSLVKSNAPSIRALVEEARKLGLSFDQLPPSLRMAAQGLTAFQDAQDKFKASTEDAARAARQFGQEAGAAFMAGGVKEWAAAHAEAVVAVVKAQQEAGVSTQQMSALQRLAYKTAKEAVGEHKLAIDDYARGAVTSYAAIAAAQKKSTDEARASASDAIANFDKQMKALNAMTVSEEEYSARKKQLYEEMVAATTAAAAKEAAATKQSKDAMAELLASLSLSPEKFAQVGEAADVYAKAIENGATPTDAAAKAVESLGKSLAGVKDPLAAVNLTPFAEGMASLGGAAGATITNVDGVVKAIASIPGQTAAAVKSLGELEAKLHAVAAASAAAAGSGSSNGPEFVGPPNPSGAAG